MNFIYDNCILCKKDIFKIEDLIFFQIKDKEIAEKLGLSTGCISQHINGRKCRR